MDEAALMRNRSRPASALALRLLVALAVLGPAAVASALTTTLSRLDTAEQLEQGELESVVLSSLGEVKLGRSAARIGLEDVSLVWALAEDAAGRVFLGTGNNGQVFRLEGDKASQLVRLDALVVSALALGEGGDLYAGTLPGGKVYRIEKAAGPGPAKASLFATLEKADHVWALAFDPARGVLFAATGPEGLVYALDRSGRPSVYYDATDEHVLSLVLERPGGDLLAGTSPEALLLRVTGPGRASALHDFEGTEVKGIARSGESLYLAVNEFPEPPAPAAELAAVKAVKGKASRRARPKPGKGKIFRRGPDGAVEALVSFDEGHLTGLEAPGDGLVYAGTGAKGRVIAVDDERVTYTVLDLEERQVLALSLGGKSPVVATGDTGAVYRIGKAQGSAAEYRSAPIDASFVSEWGALEWRGTGQLVVQTRSGNTAEPDQTWSDWSGPLARSGERVSSPPARYLQARVRWAKDGGAVLRAVSVFHRAANQRPVVTEVEVDSPFQVDRPRAEKGKAGKAAKVKRSRPSKERSRGAVLKLGWKVENPDEDELRYRLYFRGEAETVWQSILAADEVLTKTSYEWNTESVPAGHYLVKVEASDEIDNPAPRALRHFKVTPPVVVDNDPPRFRLLEAAGRRVAGRVVDGFSPIGRIEYSLDGRLWHPVLPTDGLFDSLDEPFVFELPAGLAPGPYTVAVRAFDRAENQTTGRLALTIP